MGLILGHHLPFGIGGGGGPGGPGYSFAGASGVLADGQRGPGPPPTSPYTVSAPAGAVPGDLLITWVSIGPGWSGGQSSISLRSDISPFPIWSPTGGITAFDTVVNRTVLAIHPRIATADVFDNVRVIATGNWPVMMQMALFKNAWAFGLGSITADNESSVNILDPSFVREDAPANGNIHLLDVWASSKKASTFMAGNSTTLDVTAPTITIIGKTDYISNGFGEGMVAIFGYEINANGIPGTPAGNWGLSILEANDSYAVSARYKSADT